MNPMLLFWTLVSLLTAAALVALGFQFDAWLTRRTNAKLRRLAIAAFEQEMRDAALARGKARLLELELAERRQFREFYQKAAIQKRREQEHRGSQR